MNRWLVSLLALGLSASVSRQASAQASTEASREASAEEVELCVAQHDSARRLRLAEQWSAARAAMTACADERCPLAIAADCRAWLDELTSLLPTLLIMVEREEPNAPQATLRVELDGQLVPLPDPPAPLELLPGRHRLRVALGTQPAIERSFVLEQGEKNHLEHVRFAAARVAAAPTIPRRHPLERPVPASTYWLSAGALAALAGSAALLVSGVREHDEAQANCAPTCDRSVRRSIETRLMLADITGSAALVLGGLAVYTFVRRPTADSEARSAGPGLVAAAGTAGATLSWRGEF